MIQRDHDESPNLLEGLDDTDRLALAVKFGRVRMCAALTHGHSFETSMFRLPAKCSGCQEVVWGPFTRGCTCLTCKLTAHRSCTGKNSLPPCSTKALFADFCRAELMLSRAERWVEADDMPKRVDLLAADTAHDRVGELGDWDTIEGSSKDPDAMYGMGLSAQAPTARNDLIDPAISPSWSPFGCTRKRFAIDTTSNRKAEDELINDSVRSGFHAQRAAEVATPAAVSTSAGPEKTTSQVLDAAGAPSTTASAASGGISGIRSFSRISVAGGVVGAVLAGPGGAMVGLKLGAVVAAGRWSVQGLWQKIEKDRQAAGAQEAGPLQQTATAERPRDIWSQIAERVEDGGNSAEWSLSAEYQTLLEEGECDVGEVALFVVGKILADKDTLPSRLFESLMAEFRSRHRCCRCSRRRERRREDDMVAVFPRVGGGRKVATAMTSNSAGALTDSGHVFALTPGLEKTYSFVDETELIDGEGDYAVAGEDEDSITTDVKGEQYQVSTRCACSASLGDSQNVADPSARKTAEGESWAADRPPVFVATSRDSCRKDDYRIDSWVELEGDACSNCGGRLKNQGVKDRLAASGSPTVADDELGSRGSWASADAPLCWCDDDLALSCSAESNQSGLLRSRHDPGTSTREGCGYGPDPRRSRKRPIAEGSRDQGGGGDNLEEARNVEAGVAVDVRRANGQGVEAVTDGSEDQAFEKAQSTWNSSDTTGGKACDPLRDVHGILRELSRSVLEWCPRLTSSDEAAIQAVNCIDQQVFAETYGPVYRCVADGQAQDRDSALQRQILRYVRAQDVHGDATIFADCYPEALAALRAASSARTGRDKLSFFVQCVEAISEGLPAQATTDTLLWSLCRHLAAAMVVKPADSGRSKRGPAMPRPHAEVAFVEQFVRDESWLMGKQGYVLTTVDAALHVLLDPDMSDTIWSDSNIGSDRAQGSGDEATVTRTLL